MTAAPLPQRLTETVRPTSLHLKYRMTNERWGEASRRAVPAACQAAHGAVRRSLAADLGLRRKETANFKRRKKLFDRWVKLALAAHHRCTSARPPRKLAAHRKKSVLLRGMSKQSCRAIA